MIYLSIIAGVIGIVALIVRTQTNLKEVKLSATLLSVIGLVGCAGLLVGSMLTVIPAGHVGVSVIFGKVGPAPLVEGLRIKNPFAYIVKLSVRTETYTMASIHHEGAIKGDDAIKALSKDGLALPLDVTTAFHMVDKDAPWVYRNFGKEYVESILRPSARTAIRDATSKFTFQECYSTKREDLALEMEKLLVKRIKDLIERRGGGENLTGFAMDQVMLRNVQPPQKVKQAIKAKLAAEQDAQRMEFILAKEKKEAERKRIEAEGIRDFQRIVIEGITPSYLTWKGIEATKLLAESNNAKVVVIGSGDNGLPIILGGN